MEVGNIGRCPEGIVGELNFVERTRQLRSLKGKKCDLEIWNFKESYRIFYIGLTNSADTKHKL